MDRSGLNEHHPVVLALYAAVDKILKPIVADEDRRASAHLIRPGAALRNRDQVGLRALNDALKGAFDTPGSAGFQAGDRPADRAPALIEEPADDESREPPEEGGELVDRQAAPISALRFKQALLRVHPGERRGISLLIDPTQIPPGTPVTLTPDPGLSVTATVDMVPAPLRSGWSRIDCNLRCRATVDPGARLSLVADAADHGATLVVLVVRHRASGWVREIARKEEDSETEATFDPESGIVTVYEGRREFKALERAARQAGLPKARIREYLPYRMLEVEVAANAVYSWAAQEILARRLQEERPTDAAEYAAAVYRESQALRYRAHDKLMRAFLDEEVFAGQVRVVSEPARTQRRQASLLDDH